MTVEVTTGYTLYTGNGEVSYTFPWQYWDEDDVVVRVTNGTSTVIKVRGTDYTISAPTPTGGTITLFSAWPVGVEIAIYRRSALTQETYFKNNSPFYREIHEDRLDRQVCYDQDKQLQVDLGCRFRDDDYVSDPTIPGDVSDHGEAGLMLTSDREIGFAENLVKIGEAGGHLADALSSASDALASANAAALSATNAADSESDCAATTTLVEGYSADQGMPHSVVHTSDFTAEVGVMNLYDPTGGTMTISMPPADDQHQRVGVKNATNSVLAVTIDCAGSDTIEQSDASVEMVYPGHCLQWESDGSGDWLEYSRYDDGYDSPLPELHWTDADTITIRQKPGYPDYIALTMQDGRRYYKEGTMTVTASASAGLGGPDTGSTVYGYWYYVYAVTQNRDNLGAIYSLVPPQDGGPAGYTDRWRYLGAFRLRNSTSDIAKFVQMGKEFHLKYYEDQVNMVYYNSITLSGTPAIQWNTWYTATNNTALRCPRTSRAILVGIWVDTSGTVNNTRRYTITSSETNLNGVSQTVNNYGLTLSSVFDDMQVSRRWMQTGDSDDWGVFYAYWSQSNTASISIRSTVHAWEDGYL